MNTLLLKMYMAILNDYEDIFLYHIQLEIIIVKLILI